MRLSSLPTAFLQVLQVFSLGNAAFRNEVSRRTAERKKIRARLVEVGEADLLSSLDRCHKMESWIVGMFAFIGMSFGFIFKSPMLGLLATVGGVAMASVLSGIMTDGVYGLSGMVQARERR